MRTFTPGTKVGALPLAFPGLVLRRSVRPVPRGANLVTNFQEPKKADSKAPAASQAKATEKKTLRKKAEWAEPKTVVVAVDDSLDSEYAVQWALDNMVGEGDQVHLIHCIPYIPSSAIYSVPGGGMVKRIFQGYAVPAAGSPVADPNLQRKWVEKAEQMVHRRFVERFEAYGVPFTLDVVKEAGVSGEGGVGEAICRKAKDLNASTLVLASHKLGKLSEFFLGSITNYAAHHSDTPVMVLHTPKTVAHEPSAFVPVHRKILIAMDNSATSEKALDWAIHNMYHPGDAFHILHVIPAMPLRTMYHVGADGLVYYMPPMNELEDKLTHYENQEMEDAKTIVREKFAKRLEDNEIPYELDIVTEYALEGIDSVGRAIVDIAEELDAAAVVLASHDKGSIAEFLLGSVSNYATHHSKRPVVVIHDRNRPAPSQV